MYTASSLKDNLLPAALNHLKAAALVTESKLGSEFLIRLLWAEIG
jgi:hypothetical protein